MNKELLNILNKKKFPSIVECMEYLYFAGYPLNENYEISCDLFDPHIRLNLNNLSEKELVFYSAINDSFITINENYSDFIIYVKNNNIILYQDMKNRIIDCSYNKIWEVFESKYSMEYKEIKDFIVDILVNGLKLKRYAPKKNPSSPSPILVNGLKSKNYIPRSEMPLNVGELVNGLKEMGFIPPISKI